MRLPVHPMTARRRSTGFVRSVGHRTRLREQIIRGSVMVLGVVGALLALGTGVRLLAG